MDDRKYELTLPKFSNRGIPVIIMFDAETGQMGFNAIRGLDRIKELVNFIEERGKDKRGWQIKSKIIIEGISVSKKTRKDKRYVILDSPFEDWEELRKKEANVIGLLMGGDLKEGARGGIKRGIGKNIEKGFKAARGSVKFVANKFIAADKKLGSAWKKLRENEGYVLILMVGRPAGLSKYFMAPERQIEYIYTARGGFYGRKIKPSTTKRREDVNEEGPLGWTDMQYHAVKDLDDAEEKILREWMDKTIFSMELARYIVRSNKNFLRKGNLTFEKIILESVIKKLLRDYWDVEKEEIMRVNPEIKDFKSFMDSREIPTTASELRKCWETMIKSYRENKRKDFKLGSYLGSEVLKKEINAEVGAELCWNRNPEEDNKPEMKAVPIVDEDDVRTALHKEKGESGAS